MPSTVVTLMVTPEDAERIALAQKRGQSCWFYAIPWTSFRPKPRRADGEPHGPPDAPPVVKVDKGRRGRRQKAVVEPGRARSTEDLLASKLSAPEAQRRGREDKKGDEGRREEGRREVVK